MITEELRQKLGNFLGKKTDACGLGSEKLIPDVSCA